MPDPVLITKKTEQQLAPAPAVKYELHTTFSSANLQFLLSLPAGKEKYFLDKRSGRMLGKGVSEQNEWGGAEIKANPIGKEDADRFLISISRLSKEEKSLINRIAVPKSYGAQQNDWMTVTSPLPPNYSIDDGVLTIRVRKETAKFAVLESGPAQSEIIVKPI